MSSDKRKRRVMRRRRGLVTPIVLRAAERLGRGVRRVRRTVRRAVRRTVRRARRWRTLRLAPLRLAALPFRLAWLALAAAAVALRRAWKRRKLRHLIQGAPAVAAALMIALLGLAAARQRPLLHAVYRRAAAAAVERQDWSAAKVYLQRLCELERAPDPVRFDLALTLHQLGQPERAAGIIRSLAPESEPGFAPAHRWIARRLMEEAAVQAARARGRQRQEASGSAEQQEQQPQPLAEQQQGGQQPGRPDEPQRPPAALLEAAHRHLLLARQADPRSPDVLAELANYYALVGQPRRAVEPLRLAARARPALHYELAQLYAQLGDAQAARAANRAASDYYQRVLQEAPSNTDARLRLASALMNLGRFDSAVQLLRDGLVLDPEGPCRQALAQAYVAQYDRIRGRSDADPAVLLGLLRTALQIDPRFAPALMRLVRFGEPAGAADPGETEAAEAAAGRSEQGSDARRQAVQQARRLLQSLLARGDAPAAVHLALGVQAWKRQDLAAAQKHLEYAYQLDPSLGPVANNLAWVLAEKQPPELDRALRIADSVVARWPETAAYRDTRGQILAKLGRWEEARADLERALPAMRGDPKLHHTLARVYEQLGMPDVAEQHRRLADRNAEQRGRD